MDDLDPNIRQDIERLGAEISYHAALVDVPPWRYTYSFSYMVLYVRVTEHVLRFPATKDAVRYRTVDLASITIEEGYQRRGIFKALFRELQSIAHANGRVLYVENVLNGNLKRHLSRLPGIVRLRQVGGCSEACFASAPPRGPRGTGS